MNLKKEHIIKSRLGLILRILLIASALLGITDFFLSRYDNTPPKKENQIEKPVVIDTIIKKEEDVPEATETVKETKPAPNSASIYIFGDKEIDRPASSHIGDHFFNDYKLMAIPAGFQKEQLLSANFKSTANTELVCVGTVHYSYTTKNQNYSCELSLTFDTYNKETGEKIKQLSRSIVRYGIGFSKTQAKQVAWAKVHP